MTSAPPPSGTEQTPQDSLSNSTPISPLSDGTSKQQYTQSENSVSSPTQSGLPRRRNGKPQSCEPCRKAKAACDHTLPKCQRCVRRGIPQQCTYHPAPMTRTSNGGFGNGITKLRDGTRGRAPDSVDAASKLLLLLSHQQDLDGQANPDTSQEYLGPTAYNAVFQESSDGFDERILAKEGEEYVSHGAPNPIEVTSENVQTCINALMCFPDEELCERLLERYFEYCDPILHEPSAWYCLQSLWTTWGKALKNKDRASLRHMAESIISPPHNIIRTFRSSAEWLSSFTGKNLRVVMIGNFLAVFGLAAMTIPEWDSLFTNSTEDPALSRKQYVYKIGTAAESAMKICTGKATASESLIWLLHSAEILQSQYSGDENGYLWRKAGHVATAVTSLGLHREDAVTQSTVPFMVAELRKRMFASVFISDKQLATFTGRPPRLSRRYSYCKLPLDIGDEELMLEGDELKQQLNRLDADGWDRDAKARNVTWQRAFMLMALLRDEVLEVCLGPATELTPARRDELTQRCEATYNTFPEGVKFDIHQPIAPGERWLCRKVMLRLESLLHTFLLTRLTTIPDDSLTKKQDLIDISRAILDHIICLAQNRDRLANHSYSITFALTYFGLPGAGILALELLKQHQYPQQYTMVLPRPAVIQSLSVFLFCLDMVGPDAGNYKICARMRKVIRRSLDKVLELTSSTSMPLAGMMVTPGGSSIPSLDVDMPTMMGDAPPDNTDPEFMDWLASVDWSKGPWVDTFTSL